MPEFYTIIARKTFSRFFFWEGGGRCPTAPTDPPFLRLWVVIGPHDNGFPGPGVALDGPADKFRIKFILRCIRHKIQVGLHCQWVPVPGKYETRPYNQYSWEKAYKVKGRNVTTQEILQA